MTDGAANCATFPISATETAPASVTNATSAAISLAARGNATTAIAGTFAETDAKMNARLAGHAAFIRFYCIPRGKYS